MKDYAVEDQFVCENMPELVWFGKQYLVERIYTCQEAKADATVYLDLMVYNRAFDRKIAHWRFWGNVFELKNVSFEADYCYLSGKPFRKPEGEGWISQKVKRKKLWMKQQNYRTDEVERLLALVDKIENDIGIYQSLRYALYIQNHTMKVFFWKPELYTENNQDRVARETIRKLSQFT